MEKVLVLMATYNGEKYLEQQLASVFNQKDIDVKVLIRDDGSNDKTIDVLKKWEDKADLEWYTGEHLNVMFGFYDLICKAVNSEFNYFAFCDQDDIWDADKLSIAVTELKKYPHDEIGLYYCGQRLVDEDSNLLSIHILNPLRNENARFLLNDAAGCTEVFNKSLLNKIAMYRPDYMLMHDTWLVKVCLSLGGHLIVDSNPHMSYRQHSQNVLGLRNDLKSKVRRAKHYILEQDVESQMQELKKGYEGEIVPEYQEIINDVLHYKKSIRSRLQLLNFKKYNFNNIGITITYLIKVMFNKL